MQVSLRLKQPLSRAFVRADHRRMTRKYRFVLAIVASCAACGGTSGVTVKVADSGALLDADLVAAEAGPVDIADAGAALSTADSGAPRQPVVDAGPTPYLQTPCTWDPRDTCPSVRATPSAKEYPGYCFRLHTDPATYEVDAYQRCSLECDRPRVCNQSKPADRDACMRLGFWELDEDRQQACFSVGGTCTTIGAKIYCLSPAK